MTYVPEFGTPASICDRCGFKYRLTQLRKEWTGLMVCNPCYDIKHPQLAVRGVADRGPYGQTTVGPVVFIEPSSITANDL